MTPFRPGVITLLLATVAVAAARPATADPLDDLVSAVAGFRGVGAADVHSYVVSMRVLDEEEESVPLLEAWTSPADLRLAAAGAGTPTAVVRSWALYLEPMFVARTSLLGMDLAAGAERLRAQGAVERSPRPGKGSVVAVTFPAAVDSGLPPMLQDIVRIEATLDAELRIHELTVDLRPDGEGRDSERIHLECTYDPADGSLPGLAEWTLPTGDAVRVRTTFRDDAGRRVPVGRRITFPSRWDPGETEEIRVAYGAYDFAPGAASERLADRHVFRFDVNGVVSD